MSTSLSKKIKLRNWLGFTIYGSFDTFWNNSVLMQIVYDANKLSKLVEEKKKMRNWLDFYQLKYSRSQSKRATVKVQRLNWWFDHSLMLYLTWFLLLTSCEQTGFLGLWGDQVDAINYYSSKIEILSKEVSYTV